MAPFDSKTNCVIKECGMKNKWGSRYLCCSRSAAGSRDRSTPATPVPPTVDRMDTVATAQTAHAVADYGREGIGPGIPDMSKEAVGHQLPISRLPFAPKILGFRGQFRGKDCHL